MRRRELLVGTVALAGISLVVWAQQSVVDTRHNLSVSGPGAIRATSEEQVCIFCHTPHHASPVQPLWNRRSPLNAYTVYSSSALDARPGQPTGSSKLCLSCHDGTVALGSVLSQEGAINMAGGITTLPPGSSNLGTDLSDDHPISFPFTSSLVGQDPHLVDPHLLPAAIKLDERGELQCTSCHDPHNNAFGDFLVVSNENSALCRSCHRIDNTTVPAHNDCSACHQQHSAPSGPFLLNGPTVTDTCTGCHDGSVARAGNIMSDLQKISTHDIMFNGGPGPAEPETQVSCTACHDPHTMGLGASASAGMPPNLGQVSGVNSSGAPVEVASYEFEVCFKCHADTNVARSAYVSRQITQINTRLEFATSAISYHPILAPGRNSDVPSLRPGWSTSSIMRCSDCHGSDTGRSSGGSGPDGVHGSNEPPLLVARYETMDFTPESADSYALCYQCHYRDGVNGILQDRSFPHSEHVVENSTPCSACHDAHGISSVQGDRQANSHLINFDSTIVFPTDDGRMPEFEDQGRFAGSCTLSCHGVTHINESYD